VLTNHAEFHGHTNLEGASAFLIRTPAGRTSVATARHLLGESGGVQPEVPLARLGESIDVWRVFPRTLPDRFVEVTGPILAAPGDPGFDWLVLALSRSASELPATALRLRAEPVRVGERVHLVGCSYAQPDCRQAVFAGRVTARSGDRFRFDIDPPVELPGFSGAPILDDAGQVAGLMTVWFAPRTRDQLYLEAGGEDAATLHRLLADR
jgi:hypothetical protein